MISFRNDHWSLSRNSSNKDEYQCIAVQFKVLYWILCTLIYFFQLDSIPYFWNSSDITQLLQWKHKDRIVKAKPKQGIRLEFDFKIFKNFLSHYFLSICSIQTERSGSAVYSRLAITQVDRIINSIIVYLLSTIRLRWWTRCSLRLQWIQSFNKKTRIIMTLVP